LKKKKSLMKREEQNGKTPVIKIGRVAEAQRLRGYDERVIRFGFCGNIGTGLLKGRRWLGKDFF